MSEEDRISIENFKNELIIERAISGETNEVFVKDNELLHLIEIIENLEKEIEELEEKNDRQRWLIRQLDKENTIPNIDDKILEYISKDKIKAKIKELEEYSKENAITYTLSKDKIEVLQELLEEGE